MSPEGAESGKEAPPPSLSDFLEWPLVRIILEAVVGSAGGAALALVLPGGEERITLSAGIGAVAAPVALLLTPARGSAGYRAVRYGGALAVLVSLVASFVAGPEGLRLEELLAFGLLIFGIGATGHAILAVTVDRGLGGVVPSGEGEGEG